jgi:hypothetical protein
MTQYPHIHMRITRKRREQLDIIREYLHVDTDAQIIDRCLLKMEEAIQQKQKAVVVIPQEPQSAPIVQRAQSVADWMEQEGIS